MHEQIIDLTLAAQGLFTFCYLISSFVVASNPYGGFPAVFTGLIHTAFIGISYYGIRQKPSRIIYGGILGACSVLICISLMTAIFWGQYGGCATLAKATYMMPTLAPTQAPHNANRNLMTEKLLENSARRLTGIACQHTSAMKSVCAFSVFHFLTYLGFVGILLKFKNEILATVPLEGGGYTAPADDNSKGLFDPLRPIGGIR